MFGQDDKTDELADASTTIQPSADDAATTDTGATDVSTDVSTDDAPADAGVALDTADEATDALSSDSVSGEDSSSDAPDATEPATEDTSAGSSPADETPASPTPPAAANTDELLEIKKGALGDLAPLVDHLDQHALRARQRIANRTSISQQTQNRGE